MSTKKLLVKIYELMKTKDTAELMAIWKENDHGLWSDSAFEVIEKLLSERRVILPRQGQMKVTVPHPPQFEIPWTFPYLSWLRVCLPWALFGSFLMWAFFLHPFYFLTRFHGPLWPDILIRMAAYDLSGNIQLYGKFHLILRFIEFGIMSYGILTGYFVLRKSQKAIAIVKTYLIQFLIFSIALLLFFNVIPLAILYWETTNSIFDLKLDWEVWMNTIHSYTHQGTASQLSFMIETLKVYWLPISASIIWYQSLIRSKWLATRFLQNKRSSDISLNTD